MEILCGQKSWSSQWWGRGDCLGRGLPRGVTRGHPARFQLHPTPLVLVGEIAVASIWMHVHPPAHQPSPAALPSTPRPSVPWRHPRPASSSWPQVRHHLSWDRATCRPASPPQVAWVPPFSTAPGAAAALGLVLAEAAVGVQLPHPVGHRHTQAGIEGSVSAGHTAAVAVSRMSRFWPPGTRPSSAQVAARRVRHAASKGL